MDVSVIVPTHNRKALLEACIGSLFGQDYPQDDYEVVIVDDSSNDGTQEMVRRLAQRHKNLRYFKEKKKGPAAARNLGASVSHGEIICFTDDDCVVSASWVRDMFAAHKGNPGVSAIGGYTEVDPNNTKAVTSQFLSTGAIKLRLNGREEVAFFPTCNVSYKRDIFEEEKFNESFPFPAGEDLEFCWRLFKAGKKFVHSPEIKVFHDCHRGSFLSFLRQAYMYGRGNYMVQYIHKDHPLLKEFGVNGSLSFSTTFVFNMMKIPYFSFTMTRWLLLSKKYPMLKLFEKSQIFYSFTIFKFSYLMGSLIERAKIVRRLKGTKKA